MGTAGDQKSAPVKGVTMIVESAVREPSEVDRLPQEGSWTVSLTQACRLLSQMPSTVKDISLTLELGDGPDEGREAYAIGRLVGSQYGLRTTANLKGRALTVRFERRVVGCN